MLQKLKLHLLVLVHPRPSWLITVFLMLLVLVSFQVPSHSVCDTLFPATGKSIAELICFDSYCEDATGIEQCQLCSCCAFASFTLEKENSRMKMRWEGDSERWGRGLSRARRSWDSKDQRCRLSWSNVAKGVNVMERNESSYAGRRTVHSVWELLLVSSQLS